ncbi:zona pellucida sperm-binding protein 4-like [Brienomyrus brachyistius]|uniref:zona pellucida sperm-binding protein 4-like n=1 Tax=Brienomyrus brachyistius TaxID=42636 RepID=UPI0020B40BFC|nr:zona pellucida sperm-binding protein 4-like [Brienomyrus brachyistius]
MAYLRGGRLWVRAAVIFIVFMGTFAQVTLPKESMQSNNKCQVYEKLPCGVPAISSTDCDALNCCFDGQTCYYGNAVTVQCTRDGQFVVVVPTSSTVPQLDVGSLALQDGKQQAPCLPVNTTNYFAIYNFPVTACGTTTTVQGGAVVYENKMFSSYEVVVGPLGSITRGSIFILLFQCKYNGSDVVSLAAEINTVPPPLPVTAPGPLRVELRIANGQCASKGCSEGESAYTSYYQATDYPVTKVLRQPVYVEAHILERMDPNIVLLLESCWATSTPNPLSVPLWSLLVNGCPNQSDKYITTLVPVNASSGLPFPTHYKRFVVQMFTFVDALSTAYLKEKVFIHCSTVVCTPSATDSCEQRCSRKRRAVRRIPSREKILVSSGEFNVVFEPPAPVKQQNNVPQSLGYTMWGMAGVAVLGTVALVGAAVWRSQHRPRQ